MKKELPVTSPGAPLPGPISGVDRDLDLKRPMPRSRHKIEHAQEEEQSETGASHPMTASPEGGSAEQPASALDTPAVDAPAQDLQVATAQTEVQPAHIS